MRLRDRGSSPVTGLHPGLWDFLLVHLMVLAGYTFYLDVEQRKHIILSVSGEDPRAFWGDMSEF